MSKELYRTQDEHGSIIVMERSGKRILSFDSAFQQSSIYIGKPYYLVHEYTQIMLLGLVFVEAKNITILGLGGGGLPHCLSYYFPQITTKTVELRPAVINVAYQWFELPKRDNLQVICADANEYVHQAEPASTELIMSDLYEAQGMSELQAQADFIIACHNMLSDKGWLVINFHSLPDAHSPVMKQVLNVFSEVKICDVYSGNWVLYCGKSIIEIDKDEQKKRAKTLAKKLNMSLMYYYQQMRDFE